MTTYKPLIVSDGYTYQLDDPDGLTVSHITDVDYIDSSSCNSVKR
jgi:hypothetical protein